VAGRPIEAHQRRQRAEVVRLTLEDALVARVRAAAVRPSRLLALLVEARRELAAAGPTWCAGCEREQKDQGSFIIGAEPR
jgi:hypothetical protein